MGFLNDTFSTQQEARQDQYAFGIRPSCSVPKGVGLRQSLSGLCLQVQGGGPAYSSGRTVCTPAPHHFLGVSVITFVTSPVLVSMIAILPDSSKAMARPVQPARP